MHKRLSTLALPLILLCSLSQAAMYKWVDDDGQTHYSQTPPEERFGDVENIAPPPPPAESPEAAAKRLKSLKESLQKDIENEQKAKQEAAENRTQQQKSAERCQAAKKWLQQLQANSRIREKNDQGEYVVLGEEVRQQRLKKAQTAVQKECE
ncbi:conserved hypothetical protein [gamma proteobacterium HTCC5015]|nr:conserved hypothetical protein [gamma proteobacterium HTCC5015]